MADNHSGMPFIRVWDLPVRLFHWSVVLLLFLLYASAHGWLGLDMGWHMVLGKLILAILLFRIVWGFVGSDTARFANFLKGPIGILAYTRDFMHGIPFKGVGHNPMGALMMVTLMTLIGISAITGLFTDDPIGLSDGGPLVDAASRETVRTMSWVHRNIFDVTLIFAAIHITTALYYKYIKKDDIITPMVTGVEPKTLGREQPRFQSDATAFVLFVAALLVVWGGVWLFAR